MNVSKRMNDSRWAFLKRTIAAQTHFVGCVLVCIGAVTLLPLAYRVGLPNFYACLSFVLTGFVLFLVSASYHFLHDGFQISSRLGDLFENLDHFCIYLFIAGTYTPFLMGTVAPPWRGILLVLVWTLAGFGILYTLSKPRLPKIFQHRFVYTIVFVLMGWTFVVRAGEIFSNISWRAMTFLVMGGLSYSVGAVIYSIKKPNLFHGLFGYHELWHLLVLVGFMSHYAMILSFYLTNF